MNHRHFFLENNSTFSWLLVKFFLTLHRKVNNFLITTQENGEKYFSKASYQADAAQ